MRFNPYLRFNGNAKEAMTFYKECLGGELDIQTVGESPMAAQMPPESHNNVLHSSLMSDAIVVMAADGMPMSPATPGTMVSLCISGSKAEGDKIKGLYEKLSQGGKISMPLKEEFFGMYGELTDKFGVNWMFQVDNK